MPTAPTILLLSRQPEAYAVRRLVETAARLRADLRLTDPHQLELGLESGARTIRLAGTPLDPARCVVLPRIGSTSTEYSLAALEHLELAGFRTLNQSAGLSRLRSKFGMLSYLAAAGLAVPDSALLRVAAELPATVARLGGYPVVLKFIRGSQGLGVVYAADETVAGSVLEAMNYAQYDVLLQRFYPAAATRDVRIIVLGARARWAVRRVSRDGRFRSNIHRGGHSEALDIGALPEYARVAEAAAACFGLGLAGVDLIEGADIGSAAVLGRESGSKDIGSSTVTDRDSAGAEARPLLILEVNSSPGFESVEQALGVDIAGEILDYALAVGQTSV